MPRAVGPHIEPRRLRKSGNRSVDRNFAETTANPLAGKANFTGMPLSAMSHVRRCRTCDIAALNYFLCGSGVCLPFRGTGGGEDEFDAHVAKVGGLREGSHLPTLRRPNSPDPVAETQLGPAAGPKSAHDRQTQRENRTLDAPAHRSVGRPTRVWSWRSGSPPWRRSTSRRSASCLGP